jgi:acyl-CoA thioester hydrolase
MYKESVPEKFYAETTINVRFSDTDMHGHVNNSNISTYFEIGRDTILREKFELMSVENRSFVLAQYGVIFSKEINFPGYVKIISKISRVGRSSVTLEQVLYQDEVICAKSDSTIVYFNTEIRRSEHLPEWMVTLLKGAISDTE